MKLLLRSLAFQFEISMMLANDTSWAGAASHHTVVDRWDLVVGGVGNDLHLVLCWYHKVVL